MNKTFLLLVVVFFGLVALSSARPLLFIADQTAIANTTSTWSGVVFGWASAVKGETNHRLRVIGNSNINDQLTAAWLTWANGTVIANLSIAESKSDHYILGDVRLNSTVWNYVLAENVYVRVATSKFPKGAITGVLVSRAGMAVAFLDGSQILNGSSSTSVGLGYTYLYSDAFFTTRPLDLLAQNAAVDAGVKFFGRIVQNVSSPTTATFNGPANTTSSAPVLASLTVNGSIAVVTTQPNITSDFLSPETAEAYYLVSSTSRPSGDIRGQLYPLLARTHRKIPNQVDTVSGQTTIPVAGLGTLRYPNQEGVEKNFQSFVACQATQASAGANFTYEGVFKLPASTIRRNFGTVRGLIMELNLRSFGGSTWLFEWFDSTTGLFIPAATYNDTTQWNAGLVYNLDPTVADYANNRAVMAVRVSTSWPTSTSLWIDLLGVRAYQPTGLTNPIIKNIMKQLLLLPIKSDS